MRRAQVKSNGRVKEPAERREKEAGFLAFQERGEVFTRARVELLSFPHRGHDPATVRLALRQQCGERCGGRVEGLVRRLGGAMGCTVTLG